MTPKSASAEAEPSAAFTPGPWWLVDHPLQCGGVEVPHASVHATLPGGIEFCGLAHVCTDDPVGEDNARLIAAAPDLLAALTETWRVLRAAGLLNLSNGVQLGQTSWYVKISDAEALSDGAIAKALRPSAQDTSTGIVQARDESPLPQSGGAK